MKIFLTGGNGMVGRTIKAFAKQTDHIIDAPSRQELDLLDGAALERYVRASAPDLVIHTAGLVGGILANMEAPYQFCFQNLQIGMNVIQAAYKAGVPRLLNLGSSCMYPREAENPLKESALLTGPFEPTNEGYAVAKVAVAKLADFVSQQYGLAYKTFTPCNLYGMWDKFDIKNAHMIPAVIRKIHLAMVQELDVVDLWGDGTARREFLFAEDLADFIFFTLNNFEKLPGHVNVGLGYDFSINEYYAAVKEALDYRGDFIHDLSKPTGMHQKLLDISVQESLGWKPKTDLQTGIGRTYEFFLTTLN